MLRGEQEDYMNRLEILKDKIETLRSDLDQAIADGLPAEVIYEKSVNLDKVLEQYYDLGNQ